MKKLPSENEIMRNWRDDAPNPLVSISCITYNHERFIEKALQGFLIQNTEYPFEILVHDDASFDRTPQIVREYEAKYPNLIKTVIQDVNQYRQGINPIFEFNLLRAQGRYIAFCEGDDYWISPDKIQKQLKFLENNNEYTVCAHLVENFYQDDSNTPFVFPGASIQKDTYYFQDLLHRNFLNTSSVVYRWLFYSGNFPWRFTRHFATDHVFHLLHASHGSIKLLPEVMSKYRIHRNGIMSGFDKNYMHYRFKDTIEFLHNINKYSNYEYDKIIQDLIVKYKQLLIHANLDLENYKEAKVTYREIKKVMSIKNRLKYLYNLFCPKSYKYTQTFYNQLRNKLNKIYLH